MGYRGTDRGGEEPLSRSLIESGALTEIMAREMPAGWMTTEEERRLSLSATLAARPEGDIWLFAYGSLIWNPTVRVVEQRRGGIRGWHRSFCLSTVAGRGSREHPGLVLALEEGGSCEGVGLRLAAEGVERELELLWRREMITAAYLPRWVELLDAEGVSFGHAITFVMNTASPQYAGALPWEDVVRRIATARGSIGTSAEYLFRTQDGLRACGIEDAEMDQMERAVRIRLAEGKAA